MDNLNLAAILSGDIEQDQAAQSSGFARQRKLADLLLAQGQQQPQGQMISGRFVAPSWAQQLAPLANTAASFFVNDRADKQEREATKAQRLRTAMQVQKFAELEEKDPALAIQYGMSIDNKFINERVKEMLKGDKLGPDETIIRRDMRGKEVKLSGGEKETPDMINRRAALDLPKDRSLWTDAQKQAFKDYVSPQDQFERNIKIANLMQTNARLADEGIGGVAIPGMGNVPGMNLVQGGGGMRMPAPGMPPQGGGMPPQSNPMPQQGGATTPAAPQVNSLPTYQYNPRMSPKQNREAEAKFDDDMRKNVKNAKGAFDAISQVAPILQSGAPSSGWIQNQVTKIANAANIPTKASEADSQLKVLGGALVGMQPRFEGPQGVLDVELYKQMAGDVSNPDIPIESRMAALRSMVNMQKKYDPSNDWDSVLKMLTPGTKPSKSAEKQQLSAQDQQALAWANANPNDPRAAEIKQRLRK